MISTLLEIVVSFMQYLVAMADFIPDVNLPESWKVIMSYVSVVNINFDFLKGWIPGLQALRVYFIVVSVFLPLIFIFFGLLFLNSKRVVLWYFILLCGVMLVAAGTFGTIIASVTDLELDPASTRLMLYVGLGMCAFCLLMYILRQTDAIACLKSDESEATSQKEVIAAETEKLNFLKLMLCVLYIIGLTVFAIICFGFPFDGLKREIDEGTTEGFAFGLAITCLIFALIFLIWTIMMCSPKGRYYQWMCVHYVETYFLRILLIGMSLAYIPIGSGCFLMFNCNSFTCATGSRLPDAGSVYVTNSSMSTGVKWCLPCVKTSFAAQSCPKTLYDTLCETQADDRLEYDNSLTCNGMRTFFWPAAAIIIIMFVLGLPALFARLIYYCATELENFPVTNQADMDEELLWDSRIAQTDNVAKFLFEPFERKYRYTRLFQLIQKLAIVAATVYVYRRGSLKPEYVAIYASIMIHFVATVLLMWHRPFIADFEDKLAVVMSIALLLAAMFACLLIYQVDVPTWVLIVIIVLNTILPVMALIVGVILEYSRGQAAEDEEEAEKQRRIEEELKKAEAEDAAYGEQPADPNAGNVDPDAPALAVTAITVEQESASPPREKYEARSDSRDHAATAMPATSEDSTRMQKKSQSIARREFAAILKKREVEQLEKAKLVTDEVKEKLDKELEEMHEKQGDTDLLIDRGVKVQLNTFLMVAGLLGFMALACCVLGMTVGSDGAILSAFPAMHDNAHELANYITWGNFTDHCCCSYHTNPSAEAVQVVEKWVCANQLIKERVRVYQRGSTLINGLVVRSLCGMSFNGGCTVQTVSGIVSLSCPSGSGYSVDEQSFW